MSYNTDIIKKAMDSNLAEIYVFLAENGASTVPIIKEKINLSRTLIYDSLNELLAKGFIEYYKQGRNAYYKIAHPNKLYDLAEQKKQESLLFNEEIQGVVNIFTGNYNLAANKPGVKFFEGEAGVKEALEHIANNFEPNTEILSFVKVKPPEQERAISASLDEFIKKRISAKIKTNVLAIDGPDAKILKSNDKNALRETRLVPTKDLFLDFAGGEIFIYKDEICAINIEKDKYFAFSLISPAISQMLKTFFMSEWVLLANQI
jgi:sugar-specific transcriptional regulator TrmB